MAEGGENGVSSTTEGGNRADNIIRTLEAWRTAENPDPDELAWAIHEGENLCAEMRNLRLEDGRPRNISGLEKSVFMAKRCLDRWERLEAANLSASNIPQNLNRSLPYRQLPKLPVFDGTGSFRGFWGLFESTTEGWSVPEKLRELLPLLRGKAYDAVAGFEVTEANYEEIVNVIKRRFDRPEERKELLLSRLHGVQSMQHASLAVRRKTIDQLIATSRELSALGHNIDDTITPVMLPKLPDDWRVRWIRKVKNGQPSSFASLVTFLEEEVDVLETASPSASSEKHRGAAGGPIPPRNTRSYSYSALPTATHSPWEKRGSDREPRKCVACQGRIHRLAYCQAYQNYSREERLRAIQRGNLCQNCLGPHDKKLCKSQFRCLNCKGEHHSSICNRSDRPVPQQTAAGGSSSAAPTDRTGGRKSPHASTDRTGGTGKPKWSWKYCDL